MLAAVLAAAVLSAGDTECAVLTAAAAALVEDPAFKTGDVSRLAISSQALAPPSGSPDDFEGFKKASGRRDLADCPGWIAQIKADGRDVVKPNLRQIARPGPSDLEWFSRPAFSPDGKSARVIYGKGGAWGGLIMTFHLTDSGWVEEDGRVLFITAD